MLAVQPDRYDGARAARSLVSNIFSVQQGVATAEIQLDKDHEIEVSFPAPYGELDLRAMGFAYQVLFNLMAFDRVVQQSCVDECKRTGLHSDGYESDLAGIALHADKITLHYYGAVVNTEWYEVFSLCEGDWVHTRSGTAIGTGAVVQLEGPQGQHAGMANAPR